jgi:hypothetical protein
MAELLHGKVAIAYNSAAVVVACTGPVGVAVRSKTVVLVACTGPVVVTTARSEAVEGTATALGHWLGSSLPVGVPISGKLYSCTG